MNTNLKTKKQTFSDILDRCFIQSKRATLNVLIFTVISVILSRLIMLAIYSLWFSNSFTSFFEAMSKIWDGNWYTTIIRDGYPAEPSGHDKGDAASWAFFPLSPMVIRMFTLIFHLPSSETAFVVNNVFFILAMLVSYKYVMLTRNNVRLALIFILFMAFGPNNFYYSSVYTESLFMLLTIWFLYELARERYLLMGVSGAFLSATRVTGVFIVFSVLFYLICKHIRERQGSFSDFLKNIFLNARLLLGVCIIPSGLFAYMLYLHLHVGDALAFTHIQKAWGRDGSYLLEMLKTVLGSGASLSVGTLPVLYTENASTNSLDSMISWLVNNSLTSIYYTAIFVIIITVTVCTVRKKRAHETVPYVFPCAINVLTLGFVNITRYSAGTGIFILNLIEIIENKFPKPLKIATYVIFAVSSLVLQYLWFDVNFITIG